MGNERWFLKGIVGPWIEVTQKEWVAKERSAGFRPKGEDHGQPATGGFGGNNVSGRRINMDYATPEGYDWDPEFRDLVWPKTEPQKIGPDPNAPEYVVRYWDNGSYKYKSFDYINDAREFAEKFRGIGSHRPGIVYQRSVNET